MNFTIKELNELIYSLGTTASKGTLVDRELNSSLLDKLYGELNRKLQVQSDYNEVMDKITATDMKTLTDSIGKNLEPNDTLKQAVQRYSDKVKAKHIHIEEDAFAKVLKSNELKKERGWIVQQMLDYVDYCGAVSHTQLENYYKAITKSNSFSHCLINLRIPYKNRKTQRYLAKEGKPHSTAKYVVKTANPSNWVVVND